MFIILKICFYSHNPFLQDNYCIEHSDEYNTLCFPEPFCLTQDCVDCISMQRGGVVGVGWGSVEMETQTDLTQNNKPFLPANSHSTHHSEFSSWWSVITFIKNK